MSHDELGIGVGGVLVVLSHDYGPSLERLALHIDKPPKIHTKEYLGSPTSLSLREMDLQVWRRKRREEEEEEEEEEEAGGREEEEDNLLFTPIGLWKIWKEGRSGVIVTA